MSIHRLFVYGAGGHGKVVADILIANKDPNFAGFVDDGVGLRGTSVLGFPIYGDRHWLEREVKKAPVTVALGIADNSVRQVLAAKCLAWGAELATLVHPAASVSGSARLGPGTVVMAHAVINPNAKIGSGSIVNTSAVIEHDVELGDFVHVAPNAVLGGASRLGNLSHLGMGAVVIQCISIGEHTVIGAGAVVVRDIPENVIAFGVPARIHRSLNLDNSQQISSGRTSHE
jgi:UDP-N-acetylbacillosamine N-acetyltransferase